MKSFKDTQGRLWEVNLSIAGVKRAAKLLGVDLLRLEAGDPPLLTRLGTDVALLCDVVYVLVKPAADLAGITDEQFAAALGGDGIFAAQTALYEELVDFFQRLHRLDVVRAVQAQRKMIERAVERVGDRIEAMSLDREIDTQIDAALAGIPGGPSMNSPGSSASTPGP